MRAWWWLCVLVCWSVAPAFAQPPAGAADLTRARRHYAEGERLAREGRCREAIAEFREGHRLSGRALFLFNGAECARSSGDHALALALYRRYVAEDPAGQVAAEARRRIAELEPRVERAESRTATASGGTPGEHAESGGQPPRSPSTQAPDRRHADGDAPSPRREGAERSEPSPISFGADEGVSDDDDGSIFEEWPLWVAVGGVVVGAITIAIAVSASGADEGCGAGCVDLR